MATQPTSTGKVFAKAQQRPLRVPCLHRIARTRSAARREQSRNPRGRHPTCEACGLRTARQNAWFSRIAWPAAHLPGLLLWLHRPYYIFSQRGYTVGSNPTEAYIPAGRPLAALPAKPYDKCRPSDEKTLGACTFASFSHNLLRFVTSQFITFCDVTGPFKNVFNGVVLRTTPSMRSSLGTGWVPQGPSHDGL